MPKFSVSNKKLKITFYIVFFFVFKQIFVLNHKQRYSNAFICVWYWIRSKENRDLILICLQAHDLLWEAIFLEVKVTQKWKDLFWCMKSLTKENYSLCKKKLKIVETQCDWTEPYRFQKLSFSFCSSFSLFVPKRNLGKFRSVCASFARGLCSLAQGKAFFLVLRVRCAS
jgi:hypothetical protein